MSDHIEEERKRQHTNMMTSSSDQSNDNNGMSLAEMILGYQDDLHDLSPPPMKRNKTNDNNGNGNGDDGDECEGDNKADTEFENDHSKLPSIDVRFMVSSRDAGAIIGRGGANITHLRKTYDATITVPDCPSPERVLTVVANIEKISKIVKEILKFVIPPQVPTPGGKNKKDMKTPTNGTEIRMLLHTSHAGGLIGKGGTRITQLREETQAGIKIFSDCCPMSSERVCIVFGSVDVVCNAIKSILYLIQTFPIKGPNSMYDPSNFDPYLQYGGFTDPSAGPPPHAAGPPSGSRGGRGGVRGRGGRHDSMSYQQQALAMPPHAGPYGRMPPGGGFPSFMAPWPRNDMRGRGHMRDRGGMPPMPPTLDSGAFFGMGGAPIPTNVGGVTNLSNREDVSFINNVDGSASATISVPHAVVGAIIGKGGCRIKDIRMRSHAEISVGQIKSANNNRIVTVKGQANSVQVACQLICKSIDENP